MRINVSLKTQSNIALSLTYLKNALRMKDCVLMMDFVEIKKFLALNTGHVHLTLYYSQILDVIHRKTAHSTIVWSSCLMAQLLNIIDVLILQYVLKVLKIAHLWQHVKTNLKSCALMGLVLTNGSTVNTKIMMNSSHTAVVRNILSCVQMAIVLRIKICAQMNQQSKKSVVKIKSCAKDSVWIVAKRLKIVL